jgi:hypothetical protein
MAGPPRLSARDGGQVDGVNLEPLKALRCLIDNNV